jgi:hypothetical protein
MDEAFTEREGFCNTACLPCPAILAELLDKNAEKWKYAQSKVDLAGYHLSASGYCVVNTIVDAFC